MAIFVKAYIEASTHNVTHVWMCKLSFVVNFHDYYHQILLKINPNSYFDDSLF